MKKKIFTLMTLALLSIGGAWATDVKVSRTIPFSADATGYTFTGYNDGVDDLILVTQHDLGGSPLKRKSVSYDNSSITYADAYCYRNTDADGAVNGGTYSDKLYAGMQLVIADGYRLDVSKLYAKVAVGDDNFKYKIVVTDGTNTLYESADKTAKKKNANEATITPASKLILAGTVYVRMYFTITNTGTSKYIQPLEISVSGDLDTGTRYAITTVSSPVGAGTLTGGGSYYENQDVFLTATPNAGYAFVDWTTGGSQVSTSATYSFKAGAANATYTANFSAATTYTITGAIAAGQSTFGTITNEGDNDVNEGEEITFTATPNTGYAFVKWQKDGADHSNETSITVTSIADATYTAYFQKLFAVTYAAGAGSFGTQTENKLATKVYADKDGNITTWKHGYAGYDGYTQTGWNDGTTDYDFNTAITIDEDKTLTAVWEANSASLNANAAAATVTWNFGNGNIPAVEINGKTGYVIAQQSINGQTIDIPMLVDATGGGKFYNIGGDRSGNAQINANTVLTIPAVKDMVITIFCSEEDKMTASNTTVGGENTTLDGTKKATYTYTGSASSITIEMNAGRYYDKITVDYPVTALAKEITSAEYATFVPSDKVSVPSGVKAYIVTATDATTATLSEDDAITVIPANAPVVIKGDEGTYYFPKTTADPSDVAGNKLNTGAVTADGTQYILANGTSGVGFYKATPETEIAAGVAYLVSPSGSAPYFIFGIEGGTTGIDSVQGSEFTVNGEYYNLAGQRVAQPTKGLYIVNGKKVVVK